MGAQALEDKLFEIRKELNSERGMVATGGRSQNPGRIRELRRTVVRILTFMTQQKEVATGGSKSSAAHLRKIGERSKNQR